MTTTVPRPPDHPCGPVARDLIARAHERQLRERRAIARRLRQRAQERMEEDAFTRELDGRR